MVTYTGFRINTETFNGLTKESLDFFLNHGYVVLNDVFTKSELNKCESELLSMRQQYASDMELDLDQYDSRICQWRDLWMFSDVFNQFLRHKKLIESAQFFMRHPSIQLIHDHIIRKPYSLLNSTIPWHQDYPFWPVDTPDALSTWTPLEDVSENGGCLEVVDASHKWGVSPPVDFIMDPMNFDDRDDIIRIPAKKGMMVVLHSLTWHRTNQNLDEHTNRPAHISLWVPSYARYRPDLSDWHPVNDHITVEEGDYLNIDKFPIFGEFIERPSKSLNDLELHDGPVKSENTMDMFGATPRIAGQIRRIVGEIDEEMSLTDLLERSDVRSDVFSSSLNHGFLQKDQEDWLNDLFEKMLINTSAFRLHRARNVYNDAYAQWWFHLGVKWVDFWDKQE